MSQQQLLLLHGALGSKAQMDSIKALLPSEIETYELNFSGHGGTAGIDQNFSTALFANDVLAFLDKKKIDQINIFGYSMGGYVALDLALNHPQRVHKIFTLATKFNWTAESAAREVKMLDAAVILEKIPHFAQALKERHAPTDWKTLLQKTAEMMLDLGNGKALSKADFSAIIHEVCISVGGKDRMVTLEESQEVARLLPNAQFFCFEDFKHPLEQIDAAELVRQLTLFLEEK